MNMQGFENGLGMRPGGGRYTMKRASAASRRLIFALAIVSAALGAPIAGHAAQAPRGNGNNAAPERVFTFRALTNSLAGRKWAPADLEVMRGVVEKRANALLPAGSRVTATAPDRIVIRLPAGSDPRELDRVTARNDLQFYVLPQLGRPGASGAPVWDVRRTATGAEQLIDSRTGKPVPEVQLKSAVFSHPAEISGKDFAPDFKVIVPRNGAPVIQFQLTRQAAARIEDVSRAHIGWHLGLFLDRRLLVAPTIAGPIAGTGIIDNSFTASQAADMAALLSSGTLSVPLERVGTGSTAGTPTSSTSAPHR